MSSVKRICVFEHSVMTNFNCACPAIQRGQRPGFLSEGSSWLTACMSEQQRFWRDSSGRASASCAVGQDGCRIDTWPRHTKDVLKMVPVATLLGAQHYKASTGFSSLTNHASLALHNDQKKKKKKPDNNQCLYWSEDRMEDWHSC